MQSHRTLSLGYLAGLLAPFWLVLGVTLAGALYPGYNHLDQAMSLLGAKGAPTQFISPLINNYPLGALFMMFGVAVLLSFDSLCSRLSGLLIMIHGLGSFATGFFSCDVGCALEAPSTSQTLHNLAGLIMALSLLLASALWVFLGRRVLGSRGFALFSLLCTLGALGSLPLMAVALENGQGFGLYQRLNYGISLLWLAGLALMLLRRFRA